MITLCTPTYNRAYILDKLYQSLRNQTSKEFVWCIIDDGSVDNTKEMVAEWMKDDTLDFSIEYYYQQNAGEMQALNNGLTHTHTELFYFVDSDDWLVPDAVESILEFWKENSKDVDKKHLCGIMALHGESPEKVYGGVELPITGKYTTLGETFDKGFNNTLSLILRSDIAKAYPFPFIQGEKFITERYIYDKIDIHHQYVILRKIIQIKDFREDGLTRNLMRTYFNNPKGCMLYYNQGMKLHKGFVNKFKNAANYTCYACVSKDAKFLKKAENKVMTFVTAPIGLYLFLKRSIELQKLK